MESLNENLEKIKIYKYRDDVTVKELFKIRRFIDQLENEVKCYYRSEGGFTGSNFIDSQFSEITNGVYGYLKNPYKEVIPTIKNTKYYIEYTIEHFNYTNLAQYLDLYENKKTRMRLSSFLNIDNLIETTEDFLEAKDLIVSANKKSKSIFKRYLNLRGLDYSIEDDQFVTQSISIYEKTDIIKEIKKITYSLNDWRVYVSKQIIGFDRYLEEDSKNAFKKFAPQLFI